MTRMSHVLAFTLVLTAGLGHADGGPESKSRPFHGRVTAQWDNIFLAFTEEGASFEGSGPVTHMGLTQQEGVLNLGPGEGDGIFPGEGTVTITAANGDSVTFDYSES